MAVTEEGSVAVLKSMTRHFSFRIDEDGKEIEPLSSILEQLFVQLAMG